MSVWYKRKGISLKQILKKNRRVQEMVSCCERSFALLHLSPRGRRRHQQWVNRAPKKKKPFCPSPWSILVLKIVPVPSSAPLPQPPHPLVAWHCDSSIHPLLPSLTPSRPGPSRSKWRYRSPLVCVLPFTQFFTATTHLPKPFPLVSSFFSLHVAVITWRRIRTWRWPMRTRLSITARRSRRLILVSQRHIVKCRSPVWMH